MHGARVNVVVRVCRLWCASGAVHDGLVRPREWLVDPALFGKSLRAEWRKMPATLTAREAAERSAALVQHRFCCHFEAELRDANDMVKDVAERVGVEPGHLSHVLRGRQKLSMEMMLLLVIDSGSIELFPELTSIADLMPD